jgi:hypothetical protein
MDSRSSRRSVVSLARFTSTISHTNTGTEVPLGSAGHARRILADNGDAQKEDNPRDQSNFGMIYETVYDAQFDPAK